MLRATFQKPFKSGRFLSSREDRAQLPHVVIRAVASLILFRRSRQCSVLRPSSTHGVRPQVRTQFCADFIQGPKNKGFLNFYEGSRDSHHDSSHMAKHRPPGCVIPVLRSEGAK